ncbi:protein-glutamine gamma-glutamyltransferase E-like isoform X3 [Rana temporaria]|uniref:protein-glutamine gamma-glutamyltransferase E-like isoform X3 n=1 Tax=Rana temporaria TaxID=8407 RepID=UPI001AADE688|nr:protein-glutamine gamma-glutamyltransferase E-like isoform X3 [Rana temporaria]
MSNLLVTSIDFQKVKNATAHKTQDYDTNEMVLRRGQPVTMAFTCNRQITSGDEFKIIVETGPSPSTQTNTKAEMLVSSSSSGTSWSAVRGSISNTVMNITINIPVNAPIGRYNMRVQSTRRGRTNVFKAETFAVLFNPWAPNDEVYMSNEAERTEYILNETGLYWFGNANNYGSRRWDYAQFERDILNITLTMLDKNLEYRKNPALDVSRRHDPLYVGRVLSAMVNSIDDNGIIIGRWTNDYSDGVSPGTWNGSAPILRQWMQSGPVRYGQCWVYAGVLCTAFKCLGIPARTIINFESAHDGDQNLQVDEIYDENGVRDDYETQDSVWNFHAWLSAWIARKDLGLEYGGWQEYDATPQEPSEGIYQLGPASQYAVRNGHVDKLSDTPFVYSEVNADRVTWVKSRDGTKKRVYTDTVSVGQRISTKAIRLFERKDVTDEYKYTEGSPQEREVFDKAKNLMAPNAFIIVSRESAPVKPLFNGSFKKAPETQVGEDLTVTLMLKNTVTDPQKIQINMTATSILYNSKPVKDFLTESHSVSLGPNEEKPLEMKLPYVVYREAITADNMIQVVAVCTEEKGSSLLVKTVTTLKNPPLLFRPIEDVKSGKTARVDCIFTNPLKEVVSNSTLIIEGSGLISDQKIINVPSMKPNERITIPFDIKPRRKGDRSLLADFSSKKFPNVKGFQTVPVASS